MTDHSAEFPDSVTRLVLLTDHSRRDCTIAAEATRFHRDGGQFEVWLPAAGFETGLPDDDAVASAYTDGTLVAFTDDRLVGHGTIEQVVRRDDDIGFAVADPMYLDAAEVPDDVPTTTDGQEA